MVSQNIDCGYSLEPPHTGGTIEYHNQSLKAETLEKMYISVDFSFTVELTTSISDLLLTLSEREYMVNPHTPKIGMMVRHRIFTS